MTRIRTDNVFGTVSDAPLTDSATTLNSAGLANLAAVSSAEAIITLDPNRVFGAPEIIRVTAHTGSATSATIVRGQFGTVAREHAAGTEWVHGPIASDSTDFSDDADDQGDFVPLGAWQSWTPTFTNFTPGSAAIVAKYTRIGRTVHFRLVVTLSSSTMGSNPTFTLPVTSATASEAVLGYGQAKDAGTANWQLAVWHASTTTASINYWNGSSNAASITVSAPFTWANTDAISVTGTYEAAA